MALAITHAKVSAVTDDAAASGAGEVLPSDWNASHSLTGKIDATQLDQTAAFAFTGLGATTISAQGSSASALTLTGGTVTTSQPLINATQTWNNAGTTFSGITLNITNTASVSTSLLFDFQVGGASKIKGDRTGLITTAAGLTASAGDFTASGGNFITQTTGRFQWGSRGRFSAPADGTFAIQNNGATLTTNFTTPANDTFQLGLVAADTTGVSQTLQAQGVTTGGTNNQAGGNLTIASGQGKGNVASSIIFQTPAVGVSGNTLQTMTTALTLTNTLAAFPSVLTATSSIQTGNFYSTKTSNAGFNLNASGANFGAIGTTGSASWSLGTSATTGGAITSALTWTGGTGAIQLNAYTTAGLLQNDASGNVTTNTAVNASTIPANFIAADRLTLVINGTTYYVPLATVAF